MTHDAYYSKFKVLIEHQLYISCLEHVRYRGQSASSFSSASSFNENLSALEGEKTHISELQGRNMCNTISNVISSKHGDDC